jgi:hypothetical protein
MTATHTQKKIATHAKRTLRIGAVSVLREAGRGALFIEVQRRLLVAGCWLLVVSSESAVAAKYPES